MLLLDRFKPLSLMVSSILISISFISFSKCERNINLFIISGRSYLIFIENQKLREEGSQHLILRSWGGGEVKGGEGRAGRP